MCGSEILCEIFLLLLYLCRKRSFHLLIPLGTILKSFQCNVFFCCCCLKRITSLNIGFSFGNWQHFPGCFVKYLHYFAGWWNNFTFNRLPDTNEIKSEFSHVRQKVTAPPTVCVTLKVQICLLWIRCCLDCWFCVYGWVCAPKMWSKI